MLPRRNWSMTPRRVMSLAEVVQGPVVAVARYVIDGGERRGQPGARIPLQMLDDAGLGPTEISLVPDVDWRDRQLAAGHRGAARVIDVLACRLVEQCLRVGRRERRRLQVGTAERGAIYRIVNTRIAPDRPQDAMLDVIETERFALDRDQLAAPWSDREQPGRYGDVLDRRYRIMVEHELHRQLVVKIDPKGELLAPAVGADGNTGEACKIGAETFAIGCRHTSIRNARNAVGTEPDVAAQEVVPHPMIDRRLGRVVMGLPFGPQFGPWRRLGGDSAHQ